MLLSGHLLGKSCQFGLPRVFIVFCLFVILVISRFGFESRVWFLIAPVPVPCLLVSCNLLQFIFSFRSFKISGGVQI